MLMRNIALTEHLDSFISSSVEQGHYSDASEVVREGLRLLEQRKAEDQAKLEWLRGAVQEGIDSLDRGEGETFDSMDDLAAHIRHIGKEASIAVAAGRSGAA
jgi:antitoxin ParD1/3/4